MFSRVGSQALSNCVVNCLIIISAVATEVRCGILCYWQSARWECYQALVLSLWKAVLDLNYDDRMHWAEGHKFESYCCSLIFQVSLTQFRSLPPLFEDTPNAIRELNLASNVLGSKKIFYVSFVIGVAVAFTYLQILAYKRFQLLSH